LKRLIDVSWLRRRGIRKGAIQACGCSLCATYQCEGKSSLLEKAVVEHGGYSRTREFCSIAGILEDMVDGICNYAKAIQMANGTKKNTLLDKDLQGMEL
jgi:hypothetical protein